MFCPRPHTIILLALLSLLILLQGPASIAGQTLSTTILHENIKYRKIQVDSDSGSVSVHFVLIDLAAVRDGTLSVDAAQAGDLMGRTASVQSIAHRHDAIAAINGPYFAASANRTYPLGFTALNGRFAQLSNVERPLVGFDADGDFLIDVAHPRVFVTSDTYFEPLWLWGINTSSGPNGVTCYDRSWGETVNPQDGFAVAVEPDEVEESVEGIQIEIGIVEEETWDGRIVETSDSGSITIPDGGYVLVFRGRMLGEIERYQAGAGVALFAYELPDGWESMRWITTLGPWFVHDGHPRDFSDETAYGGNITGSAQRSVIGITWNDELFFALTRGPGLSITETADVLIECNVRDAVMCDSGSSSSMWAADIGNLGSSRAVPLAFVVREIDDAPESPPPLRVWTGTLSRY